MSRKIALSICLLLLAAGGVSSEISLPVYMKLNREAMGAFRAEDFETALMKYDTLLSMIPDRADFNYMAAACCARTGENGKALDYLERALTLGLDAGDGLAEEFDTLKSAPGYEKIEKLLAEAAEPVNNSEVAYTIAEKDLLPEGIAYDPADDRFYLGSLWKCKIIRLGRDGKANDFTREKEYGLRSLAGMEVDAERRVLWAASFVSPVWQVSTPEEAGWSGVFKFDLKTGKLIKKYTLKEQGVNHLFNDITIAGNGDVYITDTFHGALYVIRNEADSLELFMKEDGFLYPNGITMGAGGSTLYMSAVLIGVYRIEIPTKEYALLALPDGVTTTRVDGMYFYDNSLVCMQNGLNRISRFFLAPDGRSVERMELIETRNPHFILPTTGAIAGDTFYYIANSQAYSVNRDGTLFPPERLEEIVILKTVLGERGE